MKQKKVLFFHRIFTYTYYIKAMISCENCNDEKIYNKLKDYLYNHDRNAHLKSVKEINKKQHILCYHILYFTDKELNYSRIQKRLSSIADIQIVLIPKTKDDIVDVIKFMKRIKKNNKTNLDNFGFKNEKNNLNNKEQKLSIFDLGVKTTIN